LLNLLLKVTELNTSISRRHFLHRDTLIAASAIYKGTIFIQFKHMPPAQIFVLQSYMVWKMAQFQQHFKSSISYVSSVDMSPFYSIYHQDWMEAVSNSTQTSGTRDRSD